ncbi:hypothetical protein GCM10007978_15640 [Shewanella hanedai]|nr:hypothetical protein GCM10007978_15640 [Shewanella hanedai]
MWDEPVSTRSRSANKAKLMGLKLAAIKTGDTVAKQKLSTVTDKVLILDLILVTFSSLKWLSLTLSIKILNGFID